MRIISAAVTHVGNVRASNEDDLYLDGYRPEGKEAEDSCSRQDGSRCFLVTGNDRDRDWHAFAVSDGMGGERYGEVASRIAVDTLAEFDGPDLGGRLAEYFREANARVCAEMQRRSVSSMGAAAAVLFIGGNTASVSNLGDCRVYGFQDGTMEQLSRDHRTDSPGLYAGALTQHLGIPPEEFLIEPHLLEHIPVREGDVFLLCSDGLTDMLPDDAIREILTERKDEAPEGIAQRLLEAALDRGGRDNVTAAVVKAVR